MVVGFRRSHVYEGQLVGTDDALKKRFVGLPMSFANSDDEDVTDGFVSELAHHLIDDGRIGRDLGLI